MPDTFHPGRLPSAISVLWASRDQVPDGEAWLSERERAVLAGLRFERRRSDWRQGRWAAKRAVARWLLLRSEGALARDRQLDLDRIEIIAADDGAPETFVDGAPGPSISLSHRARVALVAVARRQVRLGCDLELLEPRSDAFVADYLTEAEQALVGEAPVTDRDLLANLLWSAKESTLKLLHTGLRRDTRSVEVSLELPRTSLEGSVWSELTTKVADSTPADYSGWWMRDRQLLATVVTARPRPAPTALAAHG